MHGGLKISGKQRGEWIVSESTVWIESVVRPPTAASKTPGEANVPYTRPYYLRTLFLFGRSLKVWVPDYACKSIEVMNDWAIENLLNTHTSNAMRTYGTAELHADRRTA
jgi:hypothetical protein